MGENIHLTRKDELRVSRWSGGTTTELAIYPAGAVYAERNFVWRVSSATIEADESNFTPLPGVSRVLMILSGQIGLRHEGEPEVTLGRFEQTGFDGGTPTVSHGQATDFNLMVKGGEGDVEVIRVSRCTESNRPATTDDDSPAATGSNRHKVSEVYYLLEGGIDVVTAEKVLSIGQGDVLTVTAPASLSYNLTLINTDKKDTVIVKATIRHD